MKKRAELQESSYWPGYVDALTNIVLNLLFMVGIFAIGIFSMSVELSLHPKNASDDAEPVSQTSEPTQALPAPPMDALLSSSGVAPKYFVTKTIRIEDAAALAKAKDKSKQAEMQVNKSTGYALVKFIYPEDTFVLTDAILKDLGRVVIQAQEEKATTWRIWSSVNTQDPLARRGAYVRALSVRAVLLKAGVDPNLIDMQLFPVQDEEDSKSQTINLLVKN